MNKIARFSALAVVLAASVGTAFAATSTVTGGYAQSDMQGEANKAGGFNLKYRYEQDNSPLGVIGSFTYTEKDRTESGVYQKGQYYGITAGPAYRLNDWATTVSLTVQVCSSTRSKTLLWTSPTSSLVFVTLTLAPGSLALVTASNRFGDIKNPPHWGGFFLPAARDVRPGLPPPFPGGVPASGS